jgi:hypothetical protein
VPSIILKRMALSQVKQFLDRLNSSTIWLSKIIDLLRRSQNPV